jgi:Pilus formation protein N terminal region
MYRVCLALLVGCATLSGLGAPLILEAGSAVRVVVWTDLTVRAEEVGISSKQLTLIHFEMGDVSMVAVGDPSIVSVTVKGPDILLKATASTGTTNAFIWQAGRYTQWILVVRHDSKDPRLIVVKDAGPVGGEEPLTP